jgi:hypothetical protein
MLELFEEMTEDPFTTEYLEKEIQFYDPKPYDKDGVKLVLKPILGAARIDEFLNKNMWCEGPDIPMLLIDGCIWMSLTWCEVQSHFIPLNTFSGDVLLGGLGMGYAALRLAANPEVDSVTVYEINQRVIDFFYATQAGRAELDKIEVICGDIHRAAGEFDFAFIDIYPTLLSDDVLQDAHYFCEGVPGLTIENTPHFWGQELAWLGLLYAGWSRSLSLNWMEGQFFQYWQGHDKKAGMARDLTDVDFCIDLAEVLGRVNTGEE